MHEAGICHRDLTPTNILIDINLNPIITNFIISLIFKENEKLQDIAGTPKYMSPQILMMEEYDGIKNDIFSLGKLLLNMVLGMNICFQSEKGNHYYALIINKLFEEFWRDILGSSTVSEDFKNLVVRMIAYDENERPTIDEILKDKWFDELRE